VSKYLILGHGGHGKDTFAEFLCAATGWKFGSSSRVALDAIWPALQLACEYMPHEKELAFKHRGNHRRVWKELISLYNAADKSALCRRVLKDYDIYVGMRCDEEYAASRHLFTAVIYVRADPRVPPEPSMSIQYDPNSMILIDNSGEIEELQGQATALGELLLRLEAQK